MSLPKRTFVRPPTAQEAVLRELRDAIISGAIAPGAQLLQEEVAEQFGVSRVPVREALRILEGEGHLTHTAQRGYYVTALDVDDLIEIYRLRHLLESAAVRHTAGRLTEAKLAAMGELIDEIDTASAAEDIGGIARANRDFHFVLIDSPGQERLVRLIHQLWDVSSPYRSHYFAGKENRERLQKEHREILRAAVAGDTEKVVELLDVHRQNAIAELALALREQTS
jgi:DNA-binding GntR family transcriptional regulator